jgi:hypothetical protein
VCVMDLSLQLVWVMVGGDIATCREHGSHDVCVPSCNWYPTLSVHPFLTRLSLATAVSDQPGVARGRAGPTADFFVHRAALDMCQIILSHPKTSLDTTRFCLSFTACGGLPAVQLHAALGALARTSAL